MFKVKNWLDFQHYKDRNPPWLKLHKNLLDNFEFQSLPVASRALAPMLWLLASEYHDPKQGIILGNSQKLSFRLRMSVKEFEDAIRPLIKEGFIDDLDSASAVLADCKRVAIPETEEETEREEETKADTQSLFDEAWSIYPKTRAGSQAKARSAWMAAIKRNHPENLILTGVKNYATSDEVIRGYAKGFAAWLNDDRFLNDYTTVSKPSGSTTRGNRGFDALAIASAKIQEDVGAIDMRSLAKTNPALYLQRTLDNARGANHLGGGNHAALDYKPDASPVGTGSGKES